MPAADRKNAILNPLVFSIRSLNVSWTDGKIRPYSGNMQPYGLLTGIENGFPDLELGEIDRLPVFFNVINFENEIF
jgi:hypothetical protein